MTPAEDLARLQRLDPETMTTMIYKSPNGKRAIVALSIVGDIRERQTIEAPIPYLLEMAHKIIDELEEKKA